jgi:peptide/nickel transport system ATP-binding protein
MPSSDIPILTIGGLRTYFHDGQSFVRAVDGISFQIDRGERFGLAGESGSGKTQTALSISGLVQGTPGIIGGNIWIGGENTLRNLSAYCTVEEDDGHICIQKNMRQWRKEQERRMASVRGNVVSMVFQEPRRSLSPYFTIGEQAREVVAAHFGSNAANSYEERIRPLLRQMEFRPPDRILSSYPHELSGGQSQRVMLALALLSEPSLLIADEPTTLLDAITERNILELLDEVVRDQNIALLLITHDLGIMSQFVNRIAIMRGGKIIEKGATSDLLDGPTDDLHPYTRRIRRAARRSGMILADDNPSA